MREKSILCICPKCGNRAYDYIRKGAKKWSTVRCYAGCGIVFKVNITDFIKEVRSNG